LARQVGTFRVQIDIINIDDTTERMQLDEKITFGSLGFIADQLEDLHLQEPELPVEEDEQPPPICAFFAGLEEPARIDAEVNAVGATPAVSMCARSERASTTRAARAQAREAMRELKRDAEIGGLGRGIPSSKRRARHGKGSGERAAQVC
jgi:hypothetical protein